MGATKWRLSQHFVLQNPKFLVLGEDKEDLLEFLHTEEMKFANNITTVPATSRDALTSDTSLYKGKYCNQKSFPFLALCSGWIISYCKQNN